MRATPRALLILILLAALSSTLALNACRRPLPTFSPVAQTLTRLAATPAANTAEPAATARSTPMPASATPRPPTSLPTARPTPTPVPTLLPKGVSLALPAWLLDSKAQAELAAFFASLHASHTNVYLLPVDNSDDAQRLLAAGQAQLALLTDSGDIGSDLIRQDPFVLTSHLATSPLDLSLADLKALFAGQGEWDRRIVIVGDGSVERELLELEALRPDAISAPDWPAVRQVLLSHRDAVALLPWAHVTPRLRLHPVGGHVFGPQALTDGYPLVQRWRLTGDKNVAPELWQAIADGIRVDFTPPVSLIAVGDIMLARNVGTAVAENGADYPFAATADWLHSADLAFGNLEGPISAGGSRADPAAVGGLANAGFDVLALANDHIGDYGGDALLETIRLLEADAIATVGAGMNEAAAREARILDVRGLRVAFLARNGIPYGAPAAGSDSPGAAWFDPTRTLADVRAASAQSDVVVLSLHWGNEYTYAVTQDQRAFVQEAVAAGADLVLGHHSYNAQTFDVGEDWLAAFSLGSFVSDQDWSVESSQGLALRLLLDETGVRAVEPLGVYIAARQARLLPWEEGKAVLAEVLALSEGLPPGDPAPPPHAAWAFQTDGRVTDLASADLSGDGRQALIAVTGDLEQLGTVHALRNGERLWQFWTNSRINAVHVADLDDDSHDEVLLATGDLDQPSWIVALDQNGAQLWSYTVEAKVEDVIAADLDGDGRRNEVLGAEWGSFDDTIYALSADGSLRWVYETTGTPNRLLTADLDGDGAQEVVIGGDGLYALDRFGQLRWKQKVEGGAYAIDVATADLDGDGLPEVIAGIRYPAPAVVVHDATGGHRWSHPLAASATALAVSDLDGNGQPEIIVGAVDGSVTVLDPDGIPRWQAHVPGSVNRLAVSDLNGDGAVELIVAAGDDFTPGGVAVFVADGSPLLWHADAGAVTALHVGSLSGNEPEIVVGSSTGWVYPVDWTGVLPVVATPTPVVTPAEPPVVSPAEPTKPPVPTPVLTPAPRGGYRPTQASYHIEVDLDYWGHTLQAQERLTFTNTLGLPLSDILLNVPPNHTPGAFALLALTADGSPAIYELENTSLRVRLPNALQPGQVTSLEMTFSITPPTMRVGSIFGGGSAGYSENAFNAGNWHPVLAPYHAEEGWLATPWHPVGDPYVTDMGVYVVEIRTSPDVTVVGPGALEVWPDEGRWRFRIPSARTFAFAASHRYESTAETAYGVTIASYYYPEHQATGLLVVANATAAVRLFSDLFGPYPYPDLRVAEADFSGGQEFSGFMLFGSGLHQDHLDAGGGPRTVLFSLIAHETAHQWWYGVAGNDQAREPWLDEAFAKYSEQLFYERLYPEHADWRWAWMGMGSRQPASLDVTIYDYDSEGAYRDRVYLTGALFLNQLRQALGDDGFFNLIQTYYHHSANRIATTEGFLALLSQVGDPTIVQPIVNFYFPQ